MRYMVGSWTFTTLTQRGFSPAASLCEGFNNLTSPTGNPLQLVISVANDTLSKLFFTHAGPDPGRCNRCKCIGQKKIADAFIGQIFTANDKKQHFLRKHKAYNAQISTK